MKKITGFLGKNIIQIAIAIALIWFITDYRKEKSNRKIKEANQTALIKKMQTDYDSLQSSLTSLKFTDDEIKTYLQNSQDQTAGLYDELIKSEKKIIGRITQISSTLISSVDTTQNTIILDSISRLVQSIQNNDSIIIPFEDKTECFEFKARFVLSDGTSKIQVLERKYSDTINHVAYWERRKWKFLGLWNWRLFGKKIAQVEVFNNCGFSKTIIIEKKK